CLRDAPDTATAYATFERMRRPRVEKVVAYSKTLSNSKTAGPVARVFRDLMMPVALKLFASPKSHAWMYGHHIDWDEEVERMCTPHTCALRAENHLLSP